MRPALFIISGTFGLIGLIHAFANLANEITVWLFFTEKNQNLFETLLVLFVLGFFCGAFLVMGFMWKKNKNGPVDF
jgi:hypothetical protein